MDNWNPIAGIVPVLTAETLKNLEQKRDDAHFCGDTMRALELEKQIAELKELRGKKG